VDCNRLVAHGLTAFAALCARARTPSMQWSKMNNENLNS
jgi:hypothetical protein